MFSVGVVGARRVRQGTGEYIARFFAAHGARVRAVVGTSPETVAAACAGLRERHGIEARGYTSVEELLVAERPDVLAICSPMRAHREALEAAARHGVHVLCEKPVLFGEGRDLEASVREIAERFARSGRVLATVTQWPFTLEGFRRLHPAAPPLASTRRFRMLLSPMNRGARMLADSLPHPISMLRALAGPGRARPRGIAWESEEASEVRFDYEHAGGTVEVEVALRVRDSQPRPAAYWIDGREARREVRMPDYAFELASEDGRRVPVDDPLGLLVGDYLARVRRGASTEVEGLASEAAALDALTRSPAGAGLPGAGNGGTTS